MARAEALKIAEELADLLGLKNVKDRVDLMALYQAQNTLDYDVLANHVTDMEDSSSSAEVMED